MVVALPFNRVLARGCLATLAWIVHSQLVRLRLIRFVGSLRRSEISIRINRARILPTKQTAPGVA